jgi:Na+-driven multidrug efflux pump
LILAVFPGLLLNWFATDPLVWASGQQFLLIVGPVFAFQGIGFALYFAAQGGGNVSIPVAATFLRYMVAVGAGYVGVHYLGFGLTYLYGCLAVAMALYGLVSMMSLPFGWGRTVSADVGMAIKDTGSPVT